MATTTIGWTELVWNPTTGCDRVSAGCDNCYALTLAKRLKAMGSAKYQTDGDPRTSGPGFGLVMHDDDVVSQPLRWRIPRRIFVNSMSDLFHPKVTDEFLARVFAVMIAAPHHTYQVLTKRATRMRSLLAGQRFWELVSAQLGEMWGCEPPAPLAQVPEWIWLGVSVEDQDAAYQRVPDLLRTPALTRWLSCEPLLGPVQLGSFLLGRPTWAPVPGINWVVVGGESGPRHRPMDLDWARSLRDQCTSASVPFFFKQVGGRTSAAGGRLLDGREWDQYPTTMDGAAA